METFLFDIEKDAERELVRVNARGPLSREGFIRMVTEARQLAHEVHWPLLYDMREMYLPDDILLNEILSFVKSSSSLNTAEARTIRSASLVLRELLSDEIWEVYRYASESAGLLWAFFTSEQDAVEWLKS